MVGIPSSSIKLPVDCAQESLSSDFAHMLDSLGLPKLAARKLPKDNADDFCKDVSVADLDATSIQLLSSAYAGDFSLLGYIPTIEGALNASRAA